MRARIDCQPSGVGGGCQGERTQLELLGEGDGGGRWARGSLRARFCLEEGKAVIALMERAVLAAVRSLAALEVVRPCSLTFAPSWVQSEGRAPGGIGLVFSRLVEGGLDLSVAGPSAGTTSHISVLFVYCAVFVRCCRKKMVEYPGN